MERKQLLHAVLLGAFLDPLVDRPKDFFVVGAAASAKSTKALFPDAFLMPNGHLRA
jgi:hypothetical protein